MNKIFFRIIVLLCTIHAMNASAQRSGNTQVIAHRGFWSCLSEKTQNSRAAMKAAYQHDFYGSETDIWLTSDGVLMVNHDPSFSQIDLQSSTYNQVKGLHLSNGEKMPTFSELLKQLKKSRTTTKLIIEVKPHKTEERDRAAASQCVAMVKAMNLQERVEYISFSLVACRTIAECDPQARVAYLTGNLAPAKLKEMGINGIDYNFNELRKNPTWIDEAHQLGMTVNVWTVDNPDDVKEFIQKGADFITTNYPLMTEKLCKE